MVKISKIISRSKTTFLDIFSDKCIINLCFDSFLTPPTSLQQKLEFSAELAWSKHFCCSVYFMIPNCIFSAMSIE